MDKEQRNALQRAVVKARRLLEREFQEQLEGIYNILPDGRILDSAPGDPVVRGRLLDVVRHQRAGGASPAVAVESTVREAAFTVLNRFAALKMAEQRGLVRECVSRGLQSDGMRELAECAPGLRLALEDGGYRLLLEAVMDEVALDLKVLFDRRDPRAPLWPRAKALSELLETLNDPQLANLWTEDETVGWMYQYFNDNDVKEMRAAANGGAPRNSRELAVRNQFFTPRYVVEWLTDNTLGRLWYEMNRGSTRLKDQCRYLVRRPNEVFLRIGETPPEEPAQTQLSQEELLRQPVHIPHRPLKDPREIRLLDPACGSMHFGLYAFDLFTGIYDEAWDIAHGPDAATKSAETFAPFVATFPDKAAFLREVPRLIVEHNLHGIDIDPRAAQIAGLSLWLRAQRTWHQAGVKPADRPRITRSNLVCAEPMPGEKELLREFVEQQFPAGERPAFAFLLETIFDRMTLAGEAGSLLRIEEEIRTAIADAKRLWKQGSRPEQALLFSEPGGKPHQGELRLDLSGITDEQFWERAERRIYDALEAYAEQAENGGGFQRRLFANDAAQGFAFIDHCRKRYDVVVMNPPFGLALKATDKYLQASYIGSGGEEVAASFYTRALELLAAGGRIGELSSRTCFFLPTLATWRKEIVFEKSTLEFYVDLGECVLDGAVNETSAYVARKSRTQNSWGMFGMFHREELPEDALIGFASISLCPQVIARQLTDFEVLPDRPLCYWVSNDFIRSLPRLRPMGSAAAEVQMGLAPRDEFRFSRLWWEVNPRDVGRKRIWTGYAKGGQLSPYYSDVELLLKASNDLAEIKSALNHKYPYLGGNLSWVLHPENSYFQPGLTFGQRTTFLRMSVLPEGCYFSVAGKGVFGREQSTGSLLQSINTPAAQFLTYLRRELLSINPQFQEGDVARMPWPEIDGKALRKLEELGRECVAVVRAVASFNEVDHAFMAISLERGGQRVMAMADATIARNECEANGLLSGLLGLVDTDYSFIEREITPKWHGRSIANWHEPEESVDVLSYALGVAFGRWDLRYTTGDQPAPKLPDPFAPLPVCPPGMLQGDDGLPLSPEDGRRLRAEGRYALDVAWEGILLDDPEHALYLERRLRAALAALWGKGDDALEHEACALLGVPSLREWFRRPAGFFADHLKRYSKSRRQAPIYWPLSTASGSYTVWIYYQRLTADMLFKVVEFVESKLRDTKGARLQIEAAQRQAQGREAAKLVKQASELAELAQELEEMKAELLLVAGLPYKPDLNDGVQITAAPLWRLFRLPAWRKVLEATWKELEKGEYDWSQLAYSIWPERVREKCKADRSLAIAHGLEELCEVKVAPKKARGRRRRE